VIDLTTDFGKQANRRLQDEEVIWLTTVTPAGVPQPNPIWFYWDGESVILYSQPNSFRIRNIQNNPNVTLNLQGADALGNNVVVIQGEAQLNHKYEKPHLEYERKYIKYLPEMNMTSEQLAAEFSVEITIKPTRLRGG
jgi:PPOX class probable F420-dependent enzyme